MSVLNVPNFSEKSNENLDLHLIEHDGVKSVESRTITETLCLDYQPFRTLVKAHHGQ